AVGSSLHRPNLPILLLLRWTGRGAASARARSRPACSTFLAAFTSLSRTNPQPGHACVLTERPFGTLSPHPEHICDVSLGGTSTTRPPRFSAFEAVNRRSLPQYASIIADAS